MPMETRNCFVFAIGGTGSRVLRSLTHLLAAGVETKNKNTKFNIIPIIIDPHHSNDDLVRTKNLLDWYKNIKDESKPSGFFSTAINTLQSILDEAGLDLSDAYTFDLEGSSSTFEDYIDYKYMSNESRDLADLLFSGYSKDENGKLCKLLKIKMDIGFVGNPNVGSVVLNQIGESKIYKAFAGELVEGDRIFIISSIFGGTGAAGFPCLLKNIRNGVGGKNVELLKNATIGAITVLPYFNLDDTAGGSPIKYSDFIAKTKSALRYYIKNVNPIVNALYYIGEMNKRKSYPNDPGYGGQKNDAHFVELVGALAIIDFLGMEEADLKWIKDNKDKPNRPIYKEFGMIGPGTEDRPCFSDFGLKHEKLLARPLSQFALFKKYMDEYFKNSAGKMDWSKESPKLDADFTKEQFYRTYLGPFLADFWVWLVELSKNTRGFAPFVLEEGAHLCTFIRGDVVPPIKKGVFGWPFNEGHFDACLNKFKGGYSNSKEKILNMFYKGTDMLLTDHYRLGKKGVQK